MSHLETTFTIFPLFTYYYCTIDLFFCNWFTFKELGVFQEQAFFKFFKIYLFIFGCIVSSQLHAGFLQLRRAGATLRCSAQASHCGGFSCCGAWALGVRASVVVAHGLQQLLHMGSVVVARGLQSTGSVVVAHGLSCSVVCGIFLDQDLNPCPLHWKVDS